MVKIESEFLIALESLMERKKLNEKTREKYLHFYKVYTRDYPELNVKNVDDFTSKQTSSPAKAMIKNLIRAILRWDNIPLEIKREVSTIDMPIVTGKKDKRVPRYMSKSDVDRLTYSINSNKPFEDERIKLMILCQFYAGLRISELLGITFATLMEVPALKKIPLKPDEVPKRNLEEFYQAITIHSETTKFGKERIAYIPTEIFKRMVILNKNNILLHYQNKPYDKNKSMWDIKASRYKALLSKWSKDILGESYNSHSLRHGRGTNLIIDEKRPIEFVKKYLGHADIKSTQVYVHLDDSQIKEELEK